MMAALLSAWIVSAAPLPASIDDRPGHFGQIDVHLDLGQPFELDQVGTRNSGLGLLGIGGGFWLPERVQLGLELRAGAIAPPGLHAVGVNWGHLLVAKGFSPGENWLISGALLLGYYDNSFSVFPDGAIRVRVVYELLQHFDLGLAGTADLAVGELHDPIFFCAEATIGFSFR